MTVIGHGYDDNVGAPAFRNVIINGGMSVAQRNTSSASITTSGYYTVDRWNNLLNSLATWTQSVENDAPTGSGHRKSLKMLCTTANASPAAGAFNIIRTNLEGQNLQHFAKGTSSAKKFALSFWVKANITGTYIVELYDEDNSRQVSASYTISASGTWEKKTVIFPEDITGVWDNDNNTSIYLSFWLGAGSTFSNGTLNTVWATATNANRAVGQVNVAAAINNYWQVTGVQLEAGSVATPFEFEPFETTLRKCQRYFISYGGGTVYEPVALGFARGSTVADVTTFLPVEMRNPPAITVSAAGDWQLSNGITAWVCTAISDYSTQNGRKVNVFGASVASGLTTGAAVRLESQNRTTGKLNFSAEL